MRYEQKLRSYVDQAIAARDYAALAMFEAGLDAAAEEPTPEAHGEQPTANRSTANTQQPTANRSTANTQQPTANTQHPTV